MQSHQTIPPQHGLLILSYKCPLKWEDLDGDEVSRHCSTCSHSVQNFSSMLEADVEQIFARVNTGERVCIRSEGIGFRQAPRSTSIRNLFRFGLVASSVAVAWLIGFFKTPMLAKLEKSHSERANRAEKKNSAVAPYKLGEQRALQLSRDYQTRIMGSGQLAALGVPDRWVPPLQSKTNSLWSRLLSLKVSPEFQVNASRNIEQLRESIILRAENDKTVVTEDVLTLSKMYRRNGFEQSADNCLATSTAILDAKNCEADTTSHDPQKNESDEVAFETVAYSKMKNFDSSQFHSCLANYQTRMEDHQSELAGEFLRASMTLVLKNPLLLAEYKKKNISSKIKALQPDISDTLFTKLKALDSRLHERLVNLANFI